MEALTASSFNPSLNHRVQLIKFKPMLYFSQFNTIPTSFSSSKSKIYAPLSSSSSSPPSSVVSSAEIETEKEDEKFDWFSQWYPVMPECDLDKRAPHAKRVLGLDLVVWWDRNENSWKVFDDMCPHRLAPLSEGRVDQWGRLQCVYHGWCFNGSGDCKFIPQAPPDGPPVRNLETKLHRLMYKTCGLTPFCFDFESMNLCCLYVRYCTTYYESTTTKSVIVRIICFCIFIIYQTLSSTIVVASKSGHCNFRRTHSHFSSSSRT